jgi:hypothetical protein
VTTAVQRRRRCGTTARRQRQRHRGNGTGWRKKLWWKKPWWRGDGDCGGDVAITLTAKQQRHGDGGVAAMAVRKKEAAAQR